MNVASLSLCKELYELSGWRDTDVAHYEPTNKLKDFAAPAYDLGYLLRKLPNEIKQGYLILDRSGISLEYWSAGYAMFGEHNEDLEQVADTPEDAAAKLCVELFKQNILTKDKAKP